MIEPQPAAHGWSMIRNLYWMQHRAFQQRARFFVHLRFGDNEIMVPLSRARARALVGRDAKLIDLGDGSFQLESPPSEWRAYVSDRFIVLEPASMFGERPSYSVGKDYLNG